MEEDEWEGFEEDEEEVDRERHRIWRDFNTLTLCLFALNWLVARTICVHMVKAAK